jgi:MFS family permease
MEKKRVSKKVTATILSMSLLTVMAGAAIAPALGIIKAHFSSAPAMLVQFIVSMPALLIIVTNLFFLPLSRILLTRTIAATGLLLYVVAGAGCFFVDDIYVLLLLRAILGISVGLIMPLSTGLLAFYFPPEEQALSLLTGTVGIFSRKSFGLVRIILSLYAILINPLKVDQYPATELMNIGFPFLRFLAVRRYLRKLLQRSMSTSSHRHLPPTKNLKCS